MNYWFVINKVPSSHWYSKHNTDRKPVDTTRIRREEIPSPMNSDKHNNMATKDPHLPRSTLLPDQSDIIVRNVGCLVCVAWALPREDIQWDIPHLPPPPPRKGTPEVTPNEKNTNITSCIIQIDSVLKDKSQRRYTRPLCPLCTTRLVFEVYPSFPVCFCSAVLLWMLVTIKGWELLSYILVPSLYISIKLHLRRTMSVRIRPAWIGWAPLLLVFEELKHMCGRILTGFCVAWNPLGGIAHAAES